MASTILLKNGTLLIHDQDDHVVPTKADLLISDNTIARIAPDIPTADVGEVIDCTDKIVAPGFIDAHQHAWQTQLSGRHADQLFLDYMPAGNFQSSNYTLSDFYWGQLGGCLKLLDAGTTTVLDHAHLATSPEAASTAISATLSSGIRSIFALAPISKITTWHPHLAFSPEDPLTAAPWLLDTITTLGRRLNQASPSPRVTLGLGFDLWHLPRDACVPLFRAARSAGVTLLTTHMVRNATWHSFSLPGLLRDWGVLAPASAAGGDADAAAIAFPNVVFSHACGATDEDLAVVRAAAPAAHLASTPSTELHMAVGRPLMFDAAAWPVASVGGDCHATGAASVAQELRLGLAWARGEQHQRFIDKGFVPKTMWPGVEAAFNLGTVKGARAVGLEGVVGSLREGMRADVVVWEGRSPRMCCAAEEDPVAAVVAHSCAEDVWAVMVDGVVRKREGSLVEVRVEGEGKDIVGGREVLEWGDVARELVRSREGLKKKMEGVDLEKAKEVMMKTWYIDASKVVDEV